MKIAIINSNFKPYTKGGTELSISALKNGLDNAGWDVKIFSLKPLFNHVPSQDKGLHYIPMLNIYFPYNKSIRSKFLNQIWKYIDLVNIPMSAYAAWVIYKSQPDLVYTNNTKGYGPLFFFFLFVFKLKVVHTPRDYFLMDPNSSMYKKGRNLSKPSITTRILSQPKRFSSTFISHVVYTSNFMQDFHNKLGYFLKTPSSVIYNGCSIPFVRTKAKTKTTTTFGYVGRISSEKGIDILVDIFTNNREFNNAKLVIVGGTNEKVRLVTGIDVSKYSNIECIDYSHNLDFYNQIDIIIVPSKWNEPFGRVCAEALLQGIPAIVSDKGGLKEQIFHKDIGRVFTNKIELEGIMKNIVSQNIVFNLSMHMSKIQSLYSNDSMVSAYTTVFNNLARK